jgi:hypothetical protein
VKGSLLDDESSKIVMVRDPWVTRPAEYALSHLETSPCTSELPGQICESSGEARFSFLIRYQPQGDFFKNETLALGRRSFSMMSFNIPKRAISPDTSGDRASSFARQQTRREKC